MRLFDVENSNVQLTAGSKDPPYWAVAYSGGKLFVREFDYPVVLDLSTLPQKEVDVKNLLRHDAEKVVGSGKLSIKATHIEASGALDVDGFHKNEIINAKREGRRWQVSIGADDFVPEFVPDGEKREINGRLQVGPFFHARGGTIPELSFVERGGDFENHVSLAAKHKDSKGEKMVKLDSTLVEFGKTLGIDDPTGLSDEAKGILQKAFDTPERKKLTAQGKEDPPGNDGGEIAKLRAELTASFDDLKTEREAYKNDIKKTEEIRSLCASYGHPNIEVGEGENKRKMTLFAHAIDQGWDKDKTELKAMQLDLQKKEESKKDIRHPYAGYSMTAEANQYLSAAILMQSANADVEEIGNCFKAELGGEAAEKVMNEAMSQRMRNVSVVDLCKISLKAIGREFHGMGHGEDFAAHVVQEHQRHHLTASAGFSYASVSNILESTMNKNLMMSFRRTQSTWQLICHTYTANDYKAQNFYRLTQGGGFLEVGANGQIAHAKVSDSKKTASVEDYGVMLVFTTKMIVNDDMGALSSLGQSLGAHAGRAIDEKVYEGLLTRTGLTTIASTPLSYGALIKIDEHFDSLVDSEKKPIDVNWDALVVGNPYKRLASKFSTQEAMSAIAQDSSAPADVKENAMGTNEFAGRFQSVHSKWISPKLASESGSKSDPTNTRGKKLSTPANGNNTYFALSGPKSGSEYQPVRVGFLGGQRTPQVTSGSLAFDVEGIAYKAKFGFGVDDGDDEGILKLTSNA